MNPPNPYAPPSVPAIAPPPGRWKGWAFSLKLLLVHSGTLTIAILMLASPLGRKPGAIHPLLVLPFLYLLFCWLPYGICLFCGILELWKNWRTRGSAVAAGASFLILSATGYGLYRAWPAMSGI